MIIQPGLISTLSETKQFYFYLYHGNAGYLWWQLHYSMKSNKSEITICSYSTNEFIIK